ncbi:cold shock domain-containing protein [Corynebacterium sp. TAE3-ERU12]|uniref:cold-shock protein n=1 Tax=Corynebacterium sp. TAE3-ERU12 TaxID=2849491 RepID=UPI001C47A641|nr:cold shock domain-containing protein [Corynebacterium sp. TAE3-ERU12]
MPIGKIRWYDKQRGFGFVSNPGGEDVYVGHAVLPDGVTELHKNQRIEYDFADGRPGPQALRVKVLEEPTRPKRQDRPARSARRHKPEELNGMISDMISMLEATQRDLRSGRYPDRKQGRQTAEVLRAVAKELDR